MTALQCSWAISVTKICTACGESKKNDQFGAHRRSADRLKYSCKPCEAAAVKRAYDPEKRNAYNRAYYSSNRTKERKRSRLRRYGLEQTQYDALWKAAGGSCEICAVGLLDIDDYESGNSRPSNAVCIDHCHISGRVRGLLCLTCNLLLGYAKDSTVTLANATAYLTKHIGD